MDQFRANSNNYLVGSLGENPQQGQSGRDAALNRPENLLSLGDEGFGQTGELIGQQLQNDLGAVHVNSSVDIRRHCDERLGVKDFALFRAHLLDGGCDDLLQFRAQQDGWVVARFAGKRRIRLHIEMVVQI